jgi:hypothetical protein
MRASVPFYGTTIQFDSSVRSSIRQYTQGVNSDAENSDRTQVVKLKKVAINTHVCSHSSRLTGVVRSSVLFIMAALGCMCARYEAIVHAQMPTEASANSILPEATLTPTATPTSTLTPTPSPTPDLCAGVVPPTLQVQRAGGRGQIKARNVCLKGRFDFDRNADKFFYSEVDAVQGVEIAVCSKRMMPIWSHSRGGSRIVGYSEQYDCSQKVPLKLSVGEDYSDAFWNTAIEAGGGYRRGVHTSEFVYSSRDPSVICYTCAWVRLVGCFAPETRIELADGREVAIEELYAGSRIINPQTGRIATVRALVESYENESLVEIHYGTRTLRVTEGHPMNTSVGIRKAVDLKPGDALLDRSGAPITIDIITRNPANSSQRVLNLIVENSGPYTEREHILTAEGVQTGDYIMQLEISR